MNATKKNLLYVAGLIVSFGLGVWFAKEGLGARVVLAQPVEVAAKPVSSVEPSAPAPAVAVLPAESPTETARIYALVATDLRAAMAEALKLPDATRLVTLQNLMAIWLRTDRLSAAEWMTERRGLREFEPLSAQVSDAFFPDDTEMSAMFSFDLTDEKLRDVRVNKLVAYWKSGAHLKFDNSPWEVDGPGMNASKPISAPVAAVEIEKPVSNTEIPDESAEGETKDKG
ncbi:MAG: hypothetical protein QM715_09455 [Nibricoccus sp.]